MARDKLSTELNHCQGCGELHSIDDFVYVCVKCLQQKFIPRLNWHEAGFADQASFEQWWNHYKELQISNLLEILERKREQALLRRQWFIENTTEGAEPDELL
jgi:hypothetical protein